MNLNRRKFIKASTLSVSLLAINKKAVSQFVAVPTRPIVISTWDFGVAANKAALY